MPLAFSRSPASFATQSLTTFTVPKNRKPKFALLLKIIDLNNVPLVSGKSFIKWHLPHSPNAEHRGRTDRCSIKEHKVTYNYENTVPVRLVIDKNGHLQEQWIEFEILQEYSHGGKGERIKLGHIKLNLAEYVEPSEHEGEEGVTRRYLMQESKINSTLKITIHLRQLDGDRNFIPPALKTAPVFGGIAGIMVGEQGEVDEVGHMPSLSKKSGDVAELQDLYRRTLAADWTTQYGGANLIPSADKCIEDIFAGGDGWGGRPIEVGSPEERLNDGDTSGSVSGNERGLMPSQRSLSGLFRRDRHAKTKSHESLRGQSRGSDGASSAVRGRSSFEHQAQQMQSQAEGRRGRRNDEVDEFAIREDLRSWKIGSS